MVKPWIQRIVLLATALLVVLIAACAWLVASFDAERTKLLLGDWMQQHHGRELRIDGPLELRLFPRLEVGLSQVRLSEKDRADEEFLHVDEASLSVQTLPLLRRQLRVDQVELHGARLRWTRDAEGRSNIDDLLAPKPGETPGADGGQALDFDVAGVTLRDVRLTLADAATPLQGELRLETLDTGRLAAGEDAPLRLAAVLALKEPQIAGRLTLDTRLRLEPAQADLALRELALGFRGQALGVQGLDLQLGGTLQRSGASGALQAQDLKLTFAAAMAGVQLKDSTLALGRLDWAPQQQALALERLALQLQGRQGEQPLALALDWPQLQLRGEQLQGSALSGRLSLAGAQPLQAEFRAAAPSGKLEQLRLPGFQASFKSDGKTRRAGGTLAGDLLLQPMRQALALEQLALQLRLEDPQLQPLGLEARGRAQVSAQAAQWQLGGRLDGGSFRLDGRATWAGLVPDLQLQGEFASLDLNRLLNLPAPAATGAVAAAKPGAPAGATDTPVDLAPLRALQARVSLKAGRLALRQFELKDLRLDAGLEGGMLRVNRLAGGIWGGQIDAQALADARAQRLTLRGEARGIRLEPALKALAQNDQLEGTGHVRLDVATAGRSVQELKSQLAGTAAVQLRDGAVKGINLARALRGAKAALSLREDAAQKAQQAEKTDFSELTASFRISNGVARNQDLEMKSPFLRVGGEGAIDIGRSRLDYTVRATAAATSKGQDGAELAALRGLTVPVQLSGPWDAPDWRIRWSAVAAAAAEAGLKQGLEERLRRQLGMAPAAPAGAASQPAAPKETLKEQLLKGLFR